MAIAKKLKIDTSESSVTIPVEPHIGLFLGVVHLGIQRNTYEGVESLVDSLALQFELQDVLTDRGIPVIVTKIERNSMKPKANLLKFGKAFGANLEEGIDFEALVGKAALIEMVHNRAKTKVKIGGISSLPTMLKKEIKPLANTPRLFLDVEEITESQLLELPKWIREIIIKRIASSKDNNVNSKSVDL